MTAKRLSYARVSASYDSVTVLAQALALTLILSPRRGNDLGTILVCG